MSQKINLSKNIGQINIRSLNKTTTNNEENSSDTSISGSIENQNQNGVKKISKTNENRTPEKSLDDISSKESKQNSSDKKNNINNNNNNKKNK